jgi:16S rRNA (cytosine1402-N4)-methyltransferase
VGLGGHAGPLIERAGPTGRLIALDRDGDALDIARAVLQPFAGQVTLVHAPFSRVKAVLDELGAIPVDGFLIDLGVSSPQLDRAERGFSFQRSGPLDMRMDQSAGETAKDLLERVSQTELERILRDYGEERFAGRIARHIVEARERGELDSTGTLAAIVARAVPARERHKNPATRTFQALRIAVNGELAELDTFLDQAAACLRPGGRLCVIAFHSLEDRMVKRRFRALADPAGAGPRVRVLTKRIVVASEEEQARNPRSRSAKLRAAERIE